MTIDRKSETASFKSSSLCTKKQKKPSVNKKGQVLFLILMLSLPMLQWLVCWLFVNVNSILLAFQDQRTDAWTLKNFVTFWESLTAPYGEINIAIRNTFIYFIVSLIVIMPVALFIAYFFYKQIWFYKGFRVIFYLPAIISAVAMVAVFSRFIDPSGPLGKIAGWFGLQIPPEGLLGRDETATATIVVYTVWVGPCSNILLFCGAMTRIPIEILESARLEGCGAMRELLQIIFPLIWSSISTLIIFTCTSIFNASGPILLFTNGGFKTTTLSFWIFNQVYGNGAVGGSGAYNLVSCAGLCFTLVGVPIILLARWIMDRIPAVEY